jgi:Fe-coproporphyrin III synthase
MTIDRLFSIVHAVTYRCNSRCIMCNSWKKEVDKEEIQSIDYINNFPDYLKVVGITGGEPFLKKNISDIILAIHDACPKAQIIISTNGFLTDTIIQQTEIIMKKYSRIGLRISIDDLDSKHDEIRNIPNAFKMAITTLRELKNIGVKNLGVGHIIMDCNPESSQRVYNLCRTMKIEMADALLQNSDFFYQKIDNKIQNLENARNQLNWLISTELKRFNLKAWGHAFFYYGAWKFLKYGEIILPDSSCKNSVFIDPSGNIFPSERHNFILGNVIESTLESIMKSDYVKEILFKVVNDRQNTAWLIDTVRKGFKVNAWNILYWVITNKITVHFSKQTILK